MARGLPFMPSPERLHTIGSDSVNENLLCVKEGMWVVFVQNQSKISKNGGYVGGSNLILHTVNCELIHPSTPWVGGE